MVLIVDLFASLDVVTLFVCLFISYRLFEGVCVGLCCLVYLYV